MEITISPELLPDKTKFQEMVQQVTTESFDDFDSRCDRIIALMLKNILIAIQTGAKFPIAIEFPVETWSYNDKEPHSILARKWDRLIGLPFALDLVWCTNGHNSWRDEFYNTTRWHITTRASIALAKTRSVKRMFGRVSQVREYVSVYTNEIFGNEITDPCLDKAIKELDAFLNQTTPTISEDNNT